MPLSERELGYRRKHYAANKDEINARVRARRVLHGRDRIKERGYPTPTRPRPAQCECCGKESKRTLDLDHCHKTHVFRGWLCNGCNTAIGKLGDNVEGVKCAVAYLERAKCGLM